MNFSSDNRPHTWKVRLELQFITFCFPNTISRELKERLLEMGKNEQLS